MPSSDGWRRTVCHIDIVRRWTALVTVAGIDLPPASTSIDLADLPADPAPGKVFFAWANLRAERPRDVGLRDIEPQWADTGPLHFEPPLPPHPGGSHA